MQMQMPPLVRGRYEARLADTPADLAAARSLRSLAFSTPVPDGDGFDDACLHVLVHDRESGTLVCCFRLLPLPCGGDVARSYAAQYYDLGAMTAFDGPIAELGRFCLRPGWTDPDILRIAWGAMTSVVDAGGIAMLFGCSSFSGTDPARYLDVFALLKAWHLAPDRWAPRQKAAEVYRFAARLRRAPDARRAMLAMPPLLRSYLAMGGRVSDHAVVDRQLNTLHVFTGLEIAAIPASRQRLLRAVATGQDYS